MLVQNKYNRQTLKSLQGEWKRIALLFQQLCVLERRQMLDGAIMERVKQDSLPIETFLNCVATIVDQINNPFGALEVNGIYNQLDPTNHHQNTFPSDNLTEYEYCCNRIYERSIIFGAVYFIIAIENPELTDVLTTVYSKVDYKEGRPYLFHFTNALKNQNRFKNEDLNEQIPPHLIADAMALNDAYRHMKPSRRIRQFEMIVSIIDNLPPEQMTSQLALLRIITEYSLRMLYVMYGGKDDRRDIPEVDKLTIGEIINTYQTYFKDQKEAISPFIERLLDEKVPSAKDVYYRGALKNIDFPKDGQININVEVTGDYVNGDKHVRTQIDNVESGGIGVKETEK